MPKDMRALNETIRNLTAFSDALDYLRRRIKGKTDPYLLKGQEHLVTSIDYLREAERMINVAETKKKHQKMVDDMEQEEAQEKLKKQEQEEQLKAQKRGDR